MKKGFTLIELLIILSIIGILAAIIAPAIQNGVTTVDGKVITLR